ncbi:MAG: TatD family hydrolase [Thermoflexales bacterium]|nr:TatD family hydrolase [Thermoflexales bacterium]
MVDSHCHLDAPQFQQDREQVMERARLACVRAIVVPGVDLASSRAAASLAQEYQELVAAVGVHPHEAKTMDQSTLIKLRALASQAKVVAIGEIGLDYYRDLSPREVQRQAFQTQLDLAAELGLPVIVHDREAHADVLAMLRDWHGGLCNPELRTRPGVLHSFSGDTALAEHITAMGFRLGISGPVTYPNAEKTRAVVRAIPLESLLIETDAPYLAPQSRRGKRNEPAYVRYVAEAIAEARAISVEQVIEQTTRHADRLFGLNLDERR